MNTTDKLQAICSKIFGKQVIFEQPKPYQLHLTFPDGLKLQLNVVRINNHSYRVYYAHLWNRLMMSSREKGYNRSVSLFKEDVLQYVAAKRADLKERALAKSLQKKVPESVTVSKYHNKIRFAVPPELAPKVAQLLQEL